MCAFAIIVFRWQGVRDSWYTEMARFYIDRAALRGFIPTSSTHTQREESTISTPFAKRATTIPLFAHNTVPRKRQNLTTFSLSQRARSVSRFPLSKKKKKNNFPNLYFFY